MWLSNPELRHFVFTTCALLLATPRSASAQQACLAAQRSITYRVVYEQAVSIRTEVLSNTTFYPIPEAAVTVNNAPTSLDCLTTLRYTETQTVDYQDVSQSSSALTTPTVALNSFVLLVQAMPNQHDRRKIHAKRQSGSYYVSANGTITNDCTTSPIYTISSGVLTATVDGTTYTYSTSPGVASAMFAPSTIPGSIATYFTLGNNGVLNWMNSAFGNGQASFCALNNGTVYAVFQQGGQPDGCRFIQLTLFSVSSCQGLLLSTITGPSG